LQYRTRRRGIRNRHRTDIRKAVRRTRVQHQFVRQPRCHEGRVIIDDQRAADDIEGRRTVQEPLLPAHVALPRHLHHEVALLEEIPAIERRRRAVPHICRQGQRLLRQSAIQHPNVCLAVIRNPVSRPSLCPEDTPIEPHANRRGTLDVRVVVHV